MRERCAIVFAAAERGETRHFRLDLDRLGEAAARVAAITRRRYPDLAVPYHSRWRHFSAGGVDRAALVAAGADVAEQARARIDLAVVSVLLDAGAGPGWRYREAETGQVLERSEGLAVASLRAMQQGLFSADPGNPWRADAAALARMTPERLAAAFQHGPGNELPGLDGRAALLRRLGEVCAADPVRFGAPARPGHLYDYWRAQTGVLTAAEILRTLLHALGPIWPARISYRRRAARRLRAAWRGTRRRARAVSQTVAVARLFAGRTARSRGRARRRARRVDRARRIPQRRAVRRLRRHPAA